MSNYSAAHKTAQILIMNLSGNARDNNELKRFLKSYGKKFHLQTTIKNSVGSRKEFFKIIRKFSVRSEYNHNLIYFHQKGVRDGIILNEELVLFKDILKEINVLAETSFQLFGDLQLEGVSSFSFILSVFHDYIYIMTFLLSEDLPINNELSLTRVVEEGNSKCSLHVRTYHSKI